ARRPDATPRRQQALPQCAGKKPGLGAALCQLSRGVWATVGRTALFCPPIWRPAAARPADKNDVVRPTRLGAALSRLPRGVWATVGRTALFLSADLAPGRSPPGGQERRRPTRLGAALSRLPRGVWATVGRTVLFCPPIWRPAAARPADKNDAALRVWAPRYPGYRDGHGQP